MDSVLALFTCFNRKEKTRQAVRGLVEGNPEVQFSFVIVDDASTDGTSEMLKTEDFGAPIQVIQGTGGLFYSGGMALGMEKILKSGQEAQYLLMMNDDVEFDPGCIRRLIAQSKAQGNAVIIGATCDHGGQLSYRPHLSFSSSAKARQSSALAPSVPSIFFGRPTTTSPTPLS